MTTEQWKAMLAAIKQHRMDFGGYWTAFAISDGRELPPEGAWWDEDVLLVGPDSARIVGASPEQPLR